MKQRYQLFFALFIISILISACTRPQVVDELAQTMVAQTLTSIAKASETPDLTRTQIPTPTGEATATPTPTYTPEPVLEANGPTDFPDGINPLTGIAVADPTLLDRRPVLVKVANHPAVGRPHAGLSFADIVFEYYIGYGGNRFMGLFYGQDSEKIGPVRSGRLVDPQLVSMYQGILAFDSADARVYARIVEILGTRAITRSGNTCPGVCDDGRNIVISVFGDSAALAGIAERRGVEKSKPLLDGMRFDPLIPEDGVPAADVSILFGSLNKGEWIFDEASGRYLRWIEENDGYGNLKMIPLVDQLTDEQLAFSNVIVLFANYDEMSPSLHDIEVWDNTSGMRAVIFRDGQAYEATWKTTSNKAPIQFTNKDGDVFPLKPGNTWMVLMGNSSKVKTTDDVWEFIFYLP